MVFLALTAEVFDQVPLERVAEAERAVRAAASQLPTEIFQRLISSDELKKEDRELILATAKAAAGQFQHSL